MMAARGKSLAFEEREIDSLLESEYGQPNTFLALSIIYPFVDLRNQYHIDHVFPDALLKWSELQRLEWELEEVSWVFARRNRLPNLQLLDGAENNEKRKTLPNEWLGRRFSAGVERDHYCVAHDLGQAVSGGLLNFREFYSERRNRIRSKLLEVLNH